MVPRSPQDRFETGPRAIKKTMHFSIGFFTRLGVVLGSFWGSKRPPKFFQRFILDGPERPGSRLCCWLVPRWLPRPFQECFGGGLGPSWGGLGPLLGAFGSSWAFFGRSGGGSWAAFGGSWVLNVNDRWPSAPLPRLRADTAERGTSRERHRWADVCGKCRVLQCVFNDVQGGLI